jgi:hypothetical protein
MEHRQLHTVQDLIRVENWPLQAERREAGVAVECYKTCCGKISV